jgi:hypothetical protein
VEVVITQGHDHVLTVPVGFGPLVLRIALLTVVPMIAGFTMLRGFVPEAGRAATASVAAAAAGAIVLELMLATGLDLPPQVVVLLLALAAVPPILLVKDKAATPVARAAPWVTSAVAIAALMMFGRAWLTTTDRLTALHTAVVLALTAVSWFTLCLPGRQTRLIWLLLWAEVAVLAMAMLAGAAHAIVLRPVTP